MIKEYILASGSPRRKEILTQVGISFKVIPSDCEEVFTSDNPEGIVKELSYIKAKNVADNIIARHNLSESESCKMHDDIIYYVIGADTMVFIDDEKLGKPVDRKDAFNMISKLSGRRHAVCTGVSLIKLCVYRSGDFEFVSEKTFAETSYVDVMDMTSDMINEYIDTGEPFDKAGGYGIQGYFAKYIEKIDGDYYNIVGFPVCRFTKELYLLDIS